MSTSSARPLSESSDPSELIASESVGVCRSCLKALRFFWISVLVVCVGSIPVFLKFGYLREDIHQLLFPICLLAFWRLPMSSEFRIPLPIVASILGLWGLATLHVSGLLPEIRPSGYVLIARLEEDADGLKARALYKRYSEIARTYQLMPVDQEYRRFTDSDEAGRWISTERPRSPLVVFGHPNWMQIALNPTINAVVLESSFGIRAAALPSDIPGTAPVKLWWTSETFRLRLLPKSLPLPGSSLEQSLHFLAYLAQSLRYTDSAADVRRQAETLSLRLDALYGIVNLEGPWGSGTMQGFAHYFIGTLAVVEATQQSGSNVELMKAGLEDLQRATSLVVRKHDPEIYVDILNNAAIALFASSQDDADLYRAASWLRGALDVAGQYNVQGDGVRTVLANLLAVDSALQWATHH